MWLEVEFLGCKVRVAGYFAYGICDDAFIERDALAEMKLSVTNLR